MDLHPYDGRERRYRDDDPGDRSVGLGIVERILHVAPPPGARYDLAFYSGGLGVMDRLAISLPADAATASSIARGLGWVPASQALESEDVKGLIDGDLTDFVETHKAAFQPSPAPESTVWLDPGAGVNAWQLGYAQDGWLHVLGYDQG